jgi:hypothetical protein
MIAQVEWTSLAESLSRGDTEREGGGSLPAEREDIVDLVNREKGRKQCGRRRGPHQ